MGHVVAEKPDPSCRVGSDISTNVSPQLPSAVLMCGSDLERQLLCAGGYPPSPGAPGLLQAIIAEGTMFEEAMQERQNNTAGVMTSPELADAWHRVLSGAPCLCLTKQAALSRLTNNASSADSPMLCAAKP